MGIQCVYTLFPQHCSFCAPNTVHSISPNTVDSVPPKPFTLSHPTLLILCLQENVSVKVLNLSWNGFEDEGASAMGKALAHNGVLQELDISCNRLSPQGFLDLLKGLGKNETLQTLRVSVRQGSWDFV